MTVNMQVIHKQYHLFHSSAVYNLAYTPQITLHYFSLQYRSTYLYSLSVIYIITFNIVKYSNHGTNSTHRKKTQYQQNTTTTIQTIMYRKLTSVMVRGRINCNFVSPMFIYQNAKQLFIYLCIYLTYLAQISTIKFFKI